MRSAFTNTLKTTILLAFLAALFIGLPLGLLASARGWVGGTVMRLFDADAALGRLLRTIAADSGVAPVLPNLPEDVEAVLEMRSPLRRHWLPHETVADLIAENDAHDVAVPADVRTRHSS